MPVPRRLLPILAVAACTLAAEPAAAAVPYTPCQDEAGFECGTVPVPLDWSGATPGTLSLHVRRARATTGVAAVSAVVPLAGGPGQAASPFATAFQSYLTAGLGTRDLLVYDQRGTGRSAPLRCGALSRQGLSESQQVRQCAEQLGSARGYFRTAESVADIEALRIAGGYEQLVLYGVSYGTKVALAYAAAYPQRVEALILDSALTIDGPDVLRRSTFASVSRVLRELCSGSACRGLRQSVTRILSRTARKLAKGRVKGRVTAPDGSRVTFRIGEQDLFDVLLAGDLNPTLRAELPGSMRAFLDGDRTPLTRLAVRAQGLTGVATQQLSLPDNDALFLATRCEESFFPGDRFASRSTRISQARAAIAALPTRNYAPFSRTVALNAEMIVPCASWPVASATPVPGGAVPAVRTLVLEGSTDLRTPLLTGQAVAAGIPGAQVLEVPFAGHSVLGSEPRDCAARAVTTFLGGSRVSACPRISNPFVPTPTPPTRLRRVTGRTKATRTVNALIASMTDVRRQFIGDALAAGTGLLPGSQTGGLRGGYAQVTLAGTRFRGIEYVPGVRITGYLPDRGTAKFTVSGSAAARGRVTVSSSGRVRGRLGGRKVSVKAKATAASAGAVAADGPVGPLPRKARPLGGLAR